MFESSVREGVLRVRRAGTRWLATGPDGGYRDADAAYNVTVPEGFDRTDLRAYVAERRERAGFEAAGPALLTGVAMAHARRARMGSVEVVATAGVSNPAALPMPEAGGGGEAESGSDTGTGGDSWRPGTVNLLVGTTRALDDGTLATLLGTVVEAKTATLSATIGFPGTTSDAVVVGADPEGEPADFAGSATPVGRAARVCVRDAVRASLRSRYGGDESVPMSVADADYGVVADGHADVSRVE